MRLKFKDKQRKRKLHKILTPAVAAYATDLKLTNIDELIIELSYWRPRYDHGQCRYDVEKKTGTIELNGKLGELDMLVTLAHEMVHIQQFAHGHLGFEGDDWKWKGKVYKHVEEQGSDDYRALPWEEQAWRKQTTMSIKFLSTLIHEMKH